MSPFPIPCPEVIVSMISGPYFKFNKAPGYEAKRLYHAGRIVAMGRFQSRLRSLYYLCRDVTYRWTYSDVLRMPATKSLASSCRLLILPSRLVKGRARETTQRKIYNL